MYEVSKNVNRLAKGAHFGGGLISTLPSQLSLLCLRVLLQPLSLRKILDNPTGMEEES